MTVTGETVKMGIVMDPIQSINYKKDSSLAMLWEAQDRNWEIYYFEQKDLFINEGVASGNYQKLSVARDPEKWFELGDQGVIALGDLDVIFMRKDPPFDINFIYTTYFLEMAEEAGALIVNKPQSLRDCNEKIFATHFPQCCTPTLVTQNADQLKAFVEQQKKTIFKPLDGMGGASIFRVDEGQPNLNVIIETLTELGQRPIMAQKFIPEIKEGDKRILVINGEPVPYGLARIPTAGEVRGNLAAGGSGVPKPITDRERWIVSQVAPTLKAKGLIFVGLDVIGNYLTEINVTSPTCIREIDAAHDTQIPAKLMDCVTELLAKKN